MNPHIQNHHGDTPSLWNVPVVIVFIQLCFLRMSYFFLLAMMSGCSKRYFIL